ncbi:50S ribosomal protein L18 [bioreactor metagenome]|jgi:large subunit ribosomal protein L18|uniref:50S ribosomal protein L18 n=1 Tax=bioreactor metagenome TaxID=1076179 RepID=A0A645CT05_9ZZZZ
MSDIRKINEQRSKRKLRVRAKLFGTEERPRLTVFRSNKHIRLQVVDDKAGKTLAAASDFAQKSGTKSEKSAAVAKELLQALKSKKITQLVFDRSYYKYHGRVKAVAESLREGGIKF